MNEILLFGAGKSATCLIEYLVTECAKNDWQLMVCDADLQLAQKKIAGAKNAKAIAIDVRDDAARDALIQQAKLVISMLPPSLHFLVAKNCVAASKHLLTASYVDDNLRTLEKDIIEKDLLFLGEMGLDPGIDHMSAMRLIHSIKEQGGSLLSFKSHCGGLVAAESDNNPWHYKISWNPGNIVMAGADGAEYLLDGLTKKVPYKSVFRNAPELHIAGVYPLSWYPNRNSLQYLSTYGLEGIQTFVRTTLRHPAFCRGWSKLVNMGLTDTGDFGQIKDCTTFKEWFNVKTARYSMVEKDWGNYLQMYITDPYKNEFAKQLSFLQLESKDLLPKGFTNSANILQSVLENKLRLSMTDIDMIVMLHEIAYLLNDKMFYLRSKLMVKGTDSSKTAMAKTVGLPLGIAAKLILQGKLKMHGLHIPIFPEIYKPVLEELELNGIGFEETMMDTAPGS